jgi:hypothetical protein
MACGIVQYSQSKKPQGTVREFNGARSMQLGSHINQCHYGAYSPVMQQERQA